MSLEYYTFRYSKMSGERRETVEKLENLKNWDQRLQIAYGVVGFGSYLLFVSKSPDSWITIPSMAGFFATTGLTYFREQDIKKIQIADLEEKLQNNISKFDSVVASLSLKTANSFLRLFTNIKNTSEKFPDRDPEETNILEPLLEAFRRRVKRG